MPALGTAYRTCAAATVAVNSTLPTLATVAVAFCSPAAGPSVHDVDAWPWLSVSTSVALTDAPGALVAKVTVTPGTGVPSAAVTFTTKGSGVGKFARPVCGSPETLARLLGTSGPVVSSSSQAVASPRPATSRVVSSLRERISII